MSKLFLVRHGKSEWNKLGLWTGWTDVDLVEEGHEEARKAGQHLKDEEIHVVHTSPLKRTHQTLQGIKEGSGKKDLTHSSHHPLTERSYGIHTGKNKWQVKEEIGDEAFQNLRRGWDVAIPEGETLKDVHGRVMPHYENEIKKELLAGRNVLIVSHGNTLRALIKHIENLSESEVSDLEVGTGEVVCYEFDIEGKVIGKEIRI